METAGKNVDGFLPLGAFIDELGIKGPNRRAALVSPEGPGESVHHQKPQQVTLQNWCADVWERHLPSRLVSQ